MGFQSGINAMLGSVAGASFAIKKTLQQRQEESNKKAKEKQKAQQTQRRKFSEYLKNMPIGGGGTISQLSPAAQKLIAKQFSASERQKIMNKEDNKR